MVQAQDLFVLVTIVLIGLFITSAIVQWLWNMTMPEALKTPPIRYWVAFRIVLIGTLITSGGLFRIDVGG